MWFISFCKYEYEHFQYGYSNFRDKVPHVGFKSFSICVDEYVVHSLRIKDIYFFHINFMHVLHKLFKKISKLRQSIFYKQNSKTLHSEFISLQVAHFLLSTPKSKNPVQTLHFKFRNFLLVYFQSLYSQVQYFAH